MVEGSQQEMTVIPLKLGIVFCTMCCPRCPESPDPVLITGTQKPHSRECSEGVNQVRAGRDNSWQEYKQNTSMNKQGRTPES